MGTVIVPAQAADAIYMKYDGSEFPNSFNFHKLNANDTTAANACVSRKGTLAEFKGDKYCRTEKAATAT